MAEIEVTIPTVPYGNIKVKGATRHEVDAILLDFAMNDFRETVIAASNGAVGAAAKGTGAILSDEMTYEEREALATLKEGLGATESPQTTVLGASRAEFLKKYGGGNG